MSVTDRYQCYNGQRWCWCSAKQAAWAWSKGYQVRLVGPRSTDGPRVRDWFIQYGSDGLACALVWAGGGNAVEQEIRGVSI